MFRVLQEEVKLCNFSSRYLAEHFFNAGIEKGAEQERKKFEAENAARDKKIAEYLRSRGVPEDVISGGFSLK